MLCLPPDPSQCWEPLGQQSNKWCFSIMWGNICCASMSETLSLAFQMRFCCWHEGLKRLLAILVWLSLTQRLTSPLNGPCWFSAQQELPGSERRLNQWLQPGQCQKGKAWPKGRDLSRVLSHQIWAGLFSHLILYPTHYVPQGEACEGCARNPREIANGEVWAKAGSQRFSQIGANIYHCSSEILLARGTVNPF